jgi:hypothetical protein
MSQVIEPTRTQRRMRLVISRAALAASSHNCATLADAAQTPYRVIHQATSGGIDVDAATYRRVHAVLAGQGAA